MEKNMLGVMLDVSRNAVMSLDGLKEFLEILAKMGYNGLFLYAEDTYEVQGEPYFGYMRGRYSMAEMREMDAFARGLGIEIIPCIQTLGHLSTIGKWGKYPMDTGDVIMVDDERTYELIDRMFTTLSECFATRRIHVGMDEACNLGRGGHMDRFGYESPDKLIKRHLNRVLEIAEKHGYEMMIWSDMFFRAWNGGAYYTGKCEVPQAYIDALPKSVIPVYWDYYANTQDRYDDMLYNHAQLSDKTWFAGGVWTWRGFVPLNTCSIKRAPLAIKAAEKYGVTNLFFTMWGDNGAECSRYAVLPSLFYVAELVRGNEDMELIKTRFAEMFGVSFDEFMLLDTPNHVALAEGDDIRQVCPSKYMLYSDPFEGFLDYTVRPGEGETYAVYAQQLHAVSRKSDAYGYIFDTAAKLCEVLRYKYELGVHTRAAYGAGDKEALLRLLDDYAAAEENLRAFALAFERQWMRENKPYGFEVQHSRLGGLMYRLSACRTRLLDYVEGRVKSIPELEEDILPFRTKEQSIDYNNFGASFTSNVL